MPRPLQSTAPIRAPAAETTTPVPLPPIDWTATRGPVPYEAACEVMTKRVAAIVAGTAPELAWLLEHPPLYTAGTSAKPEDLVAPTRLPVYRTGRGGQYTYHGPGQRVAYVMLDVKRRYGDVRAYVADLENWMIDTLALLDVPSERWPGRVGVWVRQESNVAIGRGPRAKIAAIGVRLTRWVSSHGIALNVAPDLGHYASIVPCGIRDAGVTSLAELGRNVSADELDDALRTAFESRFGTTVAVATEAAGSGTGSLKAPA